MSNLITFWKRNSLGFVFLAFYACAVATGYCFSIIYGSQGWFFTILSLSIMLFVQASRDWKIPDPYRLILKHEFWVAYHDKDKIIQVKIRHC